VLLLADRLFVGWELWQAMAGTGADLLWRVKCGQGAPKLPVDRVCPDGSWLSRIYARSDRHRRRHPITVRVVEYILSDPGRRTSVDRYRLVTTILDPTWAPAGELAALYTERWEIETALAELKTTQRGPKQVLRSRHPRAGRPGGLGAPAGPLRPAGGDAHRRPRRGPGPRPAVVYP
jgi:hypothetical protein